METRSSSLQIVILLLLSVNSAYPSQELFPSSFYCGDEELYCPKLVANGACLGLYQTPEGVTQFEPQLAIQTVLKCRQSCKEYWDIHQDKVEPTYRNLFHQIGGTNNVIKDYFGFEHNICDPSRHQTFHSRYTLLTSSFNAWTKNMTGAIHKNSAFRPQKAKVPPQIYAIVKGYHDEFNENIPVRENCTHGTFDCLEINYTDDEECQIKEITKMNIHHLSVEDRAMIALMLEPELERLTGKNLTPALVSGMRRYLNDSFLSTHIDNTGVYDMGIVMQLGQDLDEPWPLILHDSDGSRMDVYLEEGEMVLFEKTRVPHGRNKRMRGRYFDIMTVNYIME
ncbi:hypothetical protein TCAL_04809 [Tigriopus californicus]|uniref:Uncharacterized protein n=2 Tax=Tigriopus californicus TaxID=6832 RepID=A0A553PRW4_TIGCA|nr:hypothetical protein TCAL_04809 [Tigriopus californicus]